VLRLAKELGQFQKGQSLVETLIWGAFFSIVLLAIPMIIKVADIKSKHYEAVRYAAWERTIWSNAAKSNAELAADIDMRVMGHTSQAITSTEKKENPFWSHRGRRIVNGNEQETQSAALTFSNGESPGATTAVSLFAYNGGIRGDLNLNGNGYATVGVQTSLIDRFDENNDHRYQKDDDSETFSIDSSASILSDEWSLTPASPPNTVAQENSMGASLEGLYRGRVDDLVIDEEVEVATFLGDLAAKVFLPFSDTIFIGEGNQSGTVTLPVYSEVLEDRYVKDAE